jgi:hypothetical protein
MTKYEFYMRKINTVLHFKYSFDLTYHPRRSLLQPTVDLAKIYETSFHPHNILYDFIPILSFSALHYTPYRNV